MASYSPTTVADMLAAFPIRTISPIEGRPVLKELLRVLKQLCRCARAIKSRLGPLGYLFVPLDLISYQTYTVVPLTLPGPTPDAPIFNDGMNPGEREVARLEWQAHRMENENIKNMNEALLQLFLATIGENYRKHLESSFIGRVNRTFQEIFASFLAKYGKFGPLDLQANRERMTEPWDASTPIEALFAQINDSAEFALFTRHPVADNDKVQAGEILILKTGVFGTEYKDWRSHLEVDRTWTFFQDFWQQQYDLRQETETTAGQMGYGNSLLEKEDDDTTFNDTVSNFGNAFAANSAAFNTLTDTNSSMAAGMSAIQQQLNALTAQLANINVNQAPPHVDITQAYQNVPVGPPGNLPQFQAWQANQGYQANQNNPNTQPLQPFFQAPGRGGGRGGGRGSGRGGRRTGRGAGRGRGPPPTQQYNYNQQTQAQYGPPQQNFQQAFQGRGNQNRNRPAYSNTNKRFANWNYCHTHGYDLPDDHDSTTCLNPAWNHVWTATRQNPCDGCQKNMHKVCLPTQQGYN